MSYNTISGKVLLAHGTDPAPRDAEDWTPLHVAAHTNAAEMAKVLIEYGLVPLPYFVEQGLWISVLHTKVRVNMAIDILLRWSKSQYFRCCIGYRFR